ncbi:MAG TPA: signal peptidase II [Thermopetrobacter sp.]|nr:signal peptidase II [Thermopetrobacter sp.]
MSEQDKRGGRRIHGPATLPGLLCAALAFLADQGFKLVMFRIVDFDAWPLPRIRLAPFFDIVLAWNRGVSYGWFTQQSDAGRWLLTAVALAVSAALLWWLARQRRAVPAAAIGMIIGGALANALDRVIHGAVADFFWFHVGAFSWYVFNIADVAIVAGVILLLYDSFTHDGRDAADTPRNGSAP